MALPFLKMNGLGNDFVVFDRRETGFSPSVGFLRAIGNRKRGIGCDQIIVMLKPQSPDADVYMDIYNMDGSKVQACGNATRCVASLMFAELGRDNCVIQTVAGLLKSWLDPTGLIAVDFGEPRLDWNEIPLAREAGTLKAPVANGPLDGPCCVNMGNPHAVFFVPDVSGIPLSEVGPKLEHDPMFPERCNIEIAQILAPDRIRMRVWERGTGITDACGTGACATLVAAVRRNLSARRAAIVMDGGELIIEWRDDNHVILIGPADLSFRGEVAEDFGNDCCAA
ncbi:MAG: diaminopimelate epimerase [Alphaproteobacteria bacterium]|nr:diaminopimelate epimerase [Alphaproteobacteria bacterium]